LKAFSSLLIDHFDHLNKDEIVTMSQRLRISVDNTIKMADNLITWARIQMNDYQYNEEVFKVKDIASNICEVYKNIALEKGIDLSYSVGESITIIGDKNQIEFIIRNLVNNAIKFTHKNGLVSLTAKLLSSGEVQISVSDNGVGISDEAKSKLFSISKTQSTNGTAGEKGSGLGLMLSYEFVKLSGGQIEIESNVSKGTTFHTKFKSGI
jgi:signal transduction histidine kinase